MLLSLDPILLDLALVLGLCIAVSMLFHRLRLPPVVGYLTAGAVLGPRTLGLIGHEELVRQLAEFGVVVLLFTVGLELSFGELRRMQRSVAIGGLWQITLTILLGAAASALTGLGLGPSLFVGMLLAMSSTAAVTKLLLDRALIGAPPGRFAVAICVAQDLAVVPFMLTLPLLAGRGDFLSVLGETGLSMLWLAVTIGVGYFVVRHVLDLVARTRSREMLVLTLITLCLAIAIVTSQLGLSLALGAFVAGALIASTDYQHQAVGEIEPFRDALASLFFVSIGMLFDPRVLVERPLLVVLALVAVVIGKAAIVVVAGGRVGLPRWVSVRSGLMLAQVGEFSFVLVQAAAPLALLPERFESLFLVVAVLSIALTPASFALGRLLTQRRGGSYRGSGEYTLRDHAIIIGFGPTGQSLARAMQALDLRYVAIEMNAATVKACKAKGVPIFVGDATRAGVLRAAAVDGARLLVLAMNDAEATRRAVTLARRLNPRIRILARTAFISEVAPLQDLGVDDIVPQELETSVEIIVRVLRAYLVADDQIGRLVRDVREEACGVKRSERTFEAARRSIESFVPGLGVEVWRIEPGSVAAGHTLAELEMRKTTACTLVALRRGSDVRYDLGPDTKLEEGDTVVVIGPNSRLTQASAMFRGVATTAPRIGEALGPGPDAGLQ